MRYRIAHAAVVLCAIVVAGLLMSCGGSPDIDATHSDLAVSMDAAAAGADDMAAAQSPGEGDDEDVTPVTACAGTPASGLRTSGPVTIAAQARGAVLTLKGPGRHHRLWIRRKLPSQLTVELKELSGNIPGVEIVAPGAPARRWAILELDISGCPANDDYLVAWKGAKLKSRTGTQDSVAHVVTGWIKGASGYILAQGIVAPNLTDTVSTQSAPRPPAPQPADTATPPAR